VMTRHECDVHDLADTWRGSHRVDRVRHDVDPTSLPLATRGVRYRAMSA
jgi:hypothetical protein